jgi:hypothetical protein
MLHLLNPIIEKDYDMVVGSRTLGKRKKGAMTPQSFYGNKFGTFLIKHFFGFSFTDLGPFRAIKFNKFIDLNMQDKTYGWTVEMQIKAIKKNTKSGRCLSVTGLELANQKFQELLKAL